jgi:hypothetical protein
VLVIRTAPRAGGADYLPELVGHCEADGIGGTLLNDDRAPRRWPGSNWTSSATGGRQGSLRSGWYALELASGHGQDLLLLEDDVIPATGAVREMFDYVVPEHLAFVSFFDAKKRPRVAGLLELPCSRFLFAQALKIPLRTVRGVLSGKAPADYPDPPRHMFDWNFGRFAAVRSAASYGLVLPNLVEHRGDVSVVYPERPGPFRSTWFAGAASC